MFHPDWLILRILHQSFEIERLKGHWSEVVVHLYFIYCDECEQVWHKALVPFNSLLDFFCSIKKKCKYLILF